MKIRIFTRCGSKEMSGGMKQIYRHVDILNELGYDAAVVVPNMSSRQVWFENNTRLIEAEELSLDKDDYLILGELTIGVPKVPGVNDASLVVFAQNPYGIMTGFGGDILNVLKTYRDNVKAVICVSEHSREVLDWILKTDVYRVRYSFDREPFGYCGDKQRVISFMPRKNSRDLEKAFGLLDAKGFLHNWHVESIEDRDEKDVSDIMKSSAIFVSLSSQEGFGMPPAEAMACGCVVMGYDGVAGSEFMNKGAMRSVSNTDFIGIARGIYDAIQLTDSERSRIGMASSEYIRSDYSTEAEVESIKTTWEKIIG